MPPFPTRAQINAVQKVINDRTRTAEIHRLAAEIDRAMGVGTKGHGPTWYWAKPVDTTVGIVHHLPKRTLRVAIVVAAGHCDRIATLLLEARDALAHVQINAADRADLQEGITELAKSWRARARAWRNPGKFDALTEVNVIASHYRAGVDAFARVQEYL